MNAPDSSRRPDIKLLSIVVPVYFNAPSLPDFIRAMDSVEGGLLELGIKTELIFVDDGSGDDSWSELLRIRADRPNVRLVKLSRNFGAIHAVKAAYSLVQGDCFASLAADLQDPPEMLIDMARRWLQGAKYVIAVRGQRGDPFFTRVAAAVYYRLLRLFVAPSYPLTGFDLALMDRALLPYLSQSGKNLNISVFSHWLGFNPSVMTYDRRPRAHGRSRWTLRKKVNLFLDTLLGFSIAPLRFMTAIGLLVSLASVGYGAVIVTYALFGVRDVAGFPTVVALLTFLMGLNIVMLGMIGEYVWRTFDEVNRRPEHVVEEVL